MWSNYKPDFSQNSWIHRILTGIAASITILSIIGKIIPYVQKKITTWIPDWVLLLSFFIGFVSIIFLVLLGRMNKYKQYYLAFPILNKAFSFINQIDNPDIPPQRLASDIESFRKFCTYTAKAFSQITNSKCSVCIKFLKYKKGEDVLVETFVRDDDSRLKRPSADEDEKNDIEHRLILNSDFFSIFDPDKEKELKENSFISQDLPIEYDYQNTRLNQYPNWSSKTSKWIWSRWDRKNKWPLNYRSAIIVPIVPHNINKKLTNITFEGFLCLDSSRSNVFDKNMDVEILRGLADGIYPSVRHIRQLHFSKKIK